MVYRGTGLLQTVQGRPRGEGGPAGERPPCRRSVGTSPSRIEGTNKELHTSNPLGEATCDRVRPWVTVPRHMVAVKGVNEPQPVYELLEFAGERAAGQMEIGTHG
jgi:hypothetical protein